MKDTAGTVVGALAAMSLIVGASIWISPDTSSAYPGANAQGAYDGDFHVSGGSVVPDSRYIARFRMLGAEISAGGNYDMPVTLKIIVGNTEYEPFGSMNAALAGNVNDHAGPRDFIMPDRVPAGTSFSIAGRSWVKKNSHSSGANENDWEASMTVSTVQNSPNVKVLRNGDPVPNITPFLNQSDISDLVREHIDQSTNTIKLYEDEVIYLFELGTTNLASDAADFQDLVILVTLAEDPAYFDGIRVLPGALYD